MSKSKVIERQAIGDIQLGDVYDDQGLHYKVIAIKHEDETYPIVCLVNTGDIMCYNEQVLGECKLLERSWFKDL